MCAGKASEDPPKTKTKPPLKKETRQLWNVVKGSRGAFQSTPSTSARHAVDGDSLTCIVASMDESGATWWALDMKEITAVKYITVVNVQLPYTGLLSSTSYIRL